MIPFNKQHIFGPELDYVQDAFDQGKVSGDGKYTGLCKSLIEERLQVRHALLTTSATHALEMAALLADIGPGDEVIMPSYTFVSTANAFVLRGAKPVFCDIREDNLNMDESLIEGLVTHRTKAVCPVHYAGVACDMDVIMDVADRRGLVVIEDAAQSIGAKYKGRPLGSIGHMSALSFHETKNISCGEGGALLLRDDQHLERAEILREKGTNRSQFFRGEVDKYTWVDVGSSYLPSDINAAFLWAQLERLDEITARRKEITSRYREGFQALADDGVVRLPVTNDFAEPNHHMFYLLANSLEARAELISHLKQRGVMAVFHYVPLHRSPFYLHTFGDCELPVTEDLSDRLVRLPLYFSLGDAEVDRVVEAVRDFFVLSPGRTQ